MPQVQNLNRRLTSVLVIIMSRQYIESKCFQPTWQQMTIMATHDNQGNHGNHDNHANRHDGQIVRDNRCKLHLL